MLTDTQTHSLKHTSCSPSSTCEAEDHHQTGSASPSTALVIDDERSTHLILKNWFRQTDLRGWHAVTLSEAEDILTFRQPDLIFCDLNLPGEDTLAFLERHEARGSFRGRRLVCISGCSLVEMDPVYFRYFPIFMPKPYRKEIFMEILGDQGHQFKQRHPQSLVTRLESLARSFGIDPRDRLLKTLSREASSAM